MMESELGDESREGGIIEKIQEMKQADFDLQVRPPNSGGVTFCCEGRRP